MDYSDHTAVVKLLSKMQDDERDVRDRCREQMRFLKVRDGQWEEEVVKKMGKRPRYTLDRTSRVINNIAGEIEQNEFAGRVVAKRGNIDKDISKTYDGMLRSIQNLSNADLIFKGAGRRIVECGFDAWRITTGWADVDAFNQDLLINPISDAINRVWVKYDWATADRSDSSCGFVTTALSPDEYKKQFPKGTAQSLENGSKTSNEKKSDDDDIIEADFYYIDYKAVELHLLSNGQVVRGDQFTPDIQASLALRGVVSQKTRTRELPTCYMRKLDNGGWLSEAQATVFAYVPVVTAYGNLSLIDGEIFYYGETEKLMDPQRIYNYARSREIEEGALAPRRKLLMTRKEAEGHEDQLRTMNTNADPVQFFNPDPIVGGRPTETMGPQINPNLIQTAQTTALDMENIGGQFAPSQGKPVSGHSGVSYELLQNKSDTGNNHYMESLKIAIMYTGKILVDAIPKVYDTRDREVRLLGEDGEESFVTVNTIEGGKSVRDLSQGHYDMSIVTGPSFKNRKTEALNGLLEAMRIDPTILADGRDIFFRSMDDAPGMDQMAERARARLMREGMIPLSQMTDDEKEQLQREMEQNSKPDPMNELTQAAFAAQIEELRADTMAKFQKMRDDGQMNAAKIEQILADTLKKLVEAGNASAIQSPAAQAAYQDTARQLAS